MMSLPRFRPGAGVAATSAVVALALFAPPAAAEVSVGDRATEFRQVQDGDGDAVSLREQRGDVVVVTFGASWCAPCEAELPALESLASHYAERDADVAFFAVNVDRELAKGRAFMNGFDFEHVEPVFDPRSATARLYAPPAMPSTYIIDQRGLVRVVHQGYERGDERRIRRAVDSLL